MNLRVERLANRPSILGDGKTAARQEERHSAKDMEASQIWRYLNSNKSTPLLN
jgi:hypothetical protein